MWCEECGLKNNHQGICSRSLMRGGGVYFSRDVVRQELAKGGLPGLPPAALRQQHRDELIVYQGEVIRQQAEQIRIQDELIKRLRVGIWCGMYPSVPPPPDYQLNYDEAPREPVRLAVLLPVFGMVWALIAIAMILIL